MINKDVKQAIILAKEVLNEVEIINDSQLIAESNLTLGRGFNYLGANAEALDYLSKALNIYRKLSDDIQIAYTLREIGNIYYRQGEYTSALSYFEEVLNCGNALNDTSLLILALIGKGSVYGNTNRLDSAMIIFEETLQFSKKIKDKSTEVHSLYNIGDVYRFTNRPIQALEIFKKLEKEYDVAKVNSRILSSLYLSMAVVYLSFKNAEQAREYSYKMWEALQKFPRKDHMMRYHFLSFQIDTLEKKFASAVNNHIAFKRISDSLSTSNFRENLANFQILYELNAKEQEIHRLVLDNKLKNLSLRQKNIINYGSVAIIVLLIIVVFQILRSAKKSKEKNVILQMQQEELAAANEELLAINDELHDQRKELEATLNKLRATQNQLIQSEKMASLGLLAAGVAHEINNPLNFIQGGAYTIEKHIIENFPNNFEEFSSMLETIHTGVNRASSIVKSLNHYSRSGDHISQESDIHKIIDNCLLMLNNKLKGKINVVKDYCASYYALNCNEGKIHQVLLNILSNSIDAIADKGTISISTEVIEKSFTICISDDGCGISNESLSKVTDPFFTT
jgi:signal transduction histidine kinase